MTHLNYNVVFKEPVLPDAVERTDEFLISKDGTTSHDVEDTRNGWKNGWPMRCEVNEVPRFVAHHFVNHREAEIPSHDKQDIKQTEQSLRLAALIYKYGEGGYDSGGQQQRHEGPCVKMVLAQGVGVPQVVDSCHIKASHAESA